MIFVNEMDIPNITTSHVTTYPNESDHSFLYTTINDSSIKYGPGIVRCNSSLTDNLDTKSEIEQSIAGALSQILITSLNDPFTTWESLKMAIRNIYLEKG